MFSLSRPIRAKQIKVIFLGDDQVGKTSIIRRFADDMFREKYRPTLGVQVLTKENYIYPPGTDQRLLIYLWDIGAQNLYEVVRPDYYVGISAAVFVADLTHSESITNLEYWLKEIKQHVRYRYGWAVALNKVDVIENKNSLLKRALRLLPDELQEESKVFFTSAKKNINIQELMVGILSQIIKAPE